MGAMFTPLFRGRRTRRSRGGWGRYVMGVAAVAAVGIGIWWAFSDGEKTSRSSGEEPEAESKRVVASGADARLQRGLTQLDQGRPDAARATLQEIDPAKLTPAKRSKRQEALRKIRAKRKPQHATPPKPSPSDTPSDGADPPSADTPTDASPPGGPKPDDGEATGEPEPSGSEKSDPSEEEKTSDPIQRGLAAARKWRDDGQPLRARRIANDLLSNADLSSERKKACRKLLAEVNRTLIFSSEIHEKDPYVETYKVQSGDNLAAIGDRYRVPWQFLRRINGGLEPSRLAAGEKLKVVNGPFNAVVHKSAFRLDVYLDDLYIRSFPVGLGKEESATPTGTFRVKEKVSNPSWTNPRTSKHYAADDPENPIGEHWIALEGKGDAADLEGYGLHGTIEPETIGKKASMGCVRLRPDAIERLFTMLEPGASEVRIVE